MFRRMARAMENTTSSTTSSSGSESEQDKLVSSTPTSPTTSRQKRGFGPKRRTSWTRQPKDRAAPANMAPMSEAPPQGAAPHGGVERAALALMGDSTESTSVVADTTRNHLNVTVQLRPAQDFTGEEAPAAAPAATQFKAETRNTVFGRVSRAKLAEEITLAASDAVRAASSAVDVYRKTKKRLRTAERIVKHAVEARLLFQEEFEAARLSAENASLLATKAMEEAAEYTRKIW